MISHWDAEQWICKFVLALAQIVGFHGFLIVEVCVQVTTVLSPVEVTSSDQVLQPLILLQADLDFCILLPLSTNHSEKKKIEKLRNTNQK